MACPECGHIMVYSDITDLSYLDGNTVIVIIPHTTYCDGCHCVLDAYQADVPDVQLPERTGRYYVDFEDRLWWVVDSRDEMAWDYYDSIDEALFVADVFNEAEGVM